jgi:large subunit ribosomal protein L34e
MVDRQTRMKKKKYRRTPGSKTVVHYTRHKITKAECPVTKKRLHGTGNQTKSSIRKLSKTRKRPSVKFGGVLSAKARRTIWDEAALVLLGKKNINDVSMTIRKYVKQALKVNK